MTAERQAGAEAATDATSRGTILIVDDDEEDVFALRRAFARVAPSVELRSLGDGASAVETLLAARRFEDLPDLVLLDINMPGVSGFEVLDALRRADMTRHLPVLMFSTSDYITEVRAAYAHGANAHLVKPNSMAQLNESARAIADFWLSAASLPNRTV